MKIFLLVFALVLATARAFAAAPDAVAGNVLYVSGGTVAHSSFDFAIELDDGGTFKGLFRIGTGISFFPKYLADPVDGTWTYRKIDDTTAELVLGGAYISELSGNTTMRFSTDSSGVFTAPPPGILNTAFRLAPVGARAPLSNCSNRSFVRAGGTGFTGFVITPGGSGRVLVRAIGPGLTPFGITDFLRHPTLSIVNAAGNATGYSNDGWDAAQSSESTGLSITRTDALVGAFPLSAGSKDSATIADLPPGAYVAQVSSTDATDSGQVLIEVYLLP